MSKKMWVDPPSGWRYGFPAILEPDESYEELLRKNGYPEKDIPLALEYSRFWYEGENDDE